MITAGALWTPLYEEATMQQNLQSLIDQIKMAVPTTTAAADAKPARGLPAKPGDLEAVIALRSELDGLRSELANSLLDLPGTTQTFLPILADPG